MKLTHDATMQKQKAESIENRIYLVSGAGVAIILVLSGSGAALFLIWRRSRVEVMRLKQSHQYNMEERHLTHEVRMKVLDVIAQFPSEERVEIIGKIVSAAASPPVDTTIVLNPLKSKQSTTPPPITNELTTDETNTATSKTPSHYNLPKLALMPVHDSKRLIDAQLHKLAAYRSSFSNKISPK